MSYSKIQVIKMLRDQIPDLGLKEAKDIVDSYEVKSFEDRVARAMGEEARLELRNWARLFVAGEERSSLPWNLTTPDVPLYPDFDETDSNGLDKDYNYMVYTYDEELR